MADLLLAVLIGAILTLIAVYIGGRLRSQTAPRSPYSEYLGHRVVRLALIGDRVQASPNVAKLQLGGTLRWVVEDKSNSDELNITFDGGGPFSKRCDYDPNPRRGVFETRGADIDTDPADVSGRFKYTVRWKSARLGKTVELDPDVMIKGEDN